MGDLAVSPQRFAAWHTRLATFSAPGPGVTRLVYDDAWCAAHAWLRAEAHDLGLATTVDAVGNLFLHDPAIAPGSSTILVGSHLDSVVHGGPCDGPYGTLAGLALAATFRGSRPPVVAFVTCEEEGSRFPDALTGVRAMLGQLVPDALAGLRDAGGIAWAEALAAARARGCAAPLPPAGTAVPATFRASRQLELHIEQGPVLEGAAEALGVVDRIAGYRRFQVLLTGEARHAGTTPMAARHDAFAAAAEIALVAEALAVAAGPPAVATAGFARVEPGLYNVVPGACALGLEVRHAGEGALAALAADLLGRARTIADRRGVGFACETASAEPPAALDASLVAGAEALAGERGVAYRRMASGAGHDTMVFAQSGVPALMLFVPSRGGISHHPDEYTDPAALWLGLTFAHALLARWIAERA